MTPDHKHAANAYEALARRVVVIGPTPPPYHGVAVMTRYIVEALDELGLLGAHLDTRDPQPIETIGRLNTANMALGLRHAWALHRILRRNPSADVLLPISQGRWGFLRDAVFVLVINLHHRRLILHLHGGSIDRFYATSGWVMRRVIRAVFRRAGAAWALTPSLHRMFDGLVSPSRVTHVENVTQSPHTIGSRRTERGGPASSHFRLLYLANLRREKGVFDLLEALRLLGADVAGDWRVRLVGAGAPEVIRSLQMQSAAVGARGGPHIELIDARHGRDKWLQYEWADAFVFPPSAPEGQPLVLLEAMAAALPIVTTRVGGIPDTVRHDVEALLVAPGNVDGLARALANLSRDPARRVSLGARARARYEQRYRPQRLTRDLAAMFELPAAQSSEQLRNSHIDDLTPSGNVPQAHVSVSLGRVAHQWRSG